MKNKLITTPGNPRLPGANRVGDGVNFMIEAQEGDLVRLLLYPKGSRKPVAEIPLDEACRTGRAFAVFLPGLESEKYEYNFEINGEVKLDPYARGIVGKEHFGASPEGRQPHSLRCALETEAPFDWEDTALKTPDFRDMILYKVHVRGYTKGLSRLGNKRGTFEGLKEMIPYWKDLGINAIELMPAYEFDELPQPAPQDGLVNIRQSSPAKLNFWGYGPGHYFAPKSAYCATRDPQLEVRELIRALHREKIACIMEFYFPREVTPYFVLQSLQYWKMNYHVDGFHLLGDGAPVEMALRDAILADTLILSPGIDVDRFYQDRIPYRRIYAEYNNGFQDDMRRFLKSDEGMVDKVRYRIGRCGTKHAVINYMASQDGFTLADVMSYNEKHNEDNGEGNQDGSSSNYSWNCGAEGPTRRQAIRSLRMQQLRNAFSMLLLAQEVPMIYGGDEFGNSQKGNNNAYCQDNLIGWVDWINEGKYTDLREFVKELIAFRRKHRILHMGNEAEEKKYQGRGFPVMSFHSDRAWFCSTESSSRLLGVMYAGPCARREDGEPDDYIYVGYNFSWDERSIALPVLKNGLVWKKVFDTGVKSGVGLPLGDPCGAEEYEKELIMAPRTILVLIGCPGKPAEPEEKVQECDEEQVEEGKERAVEESI